MDLSDATTTIRTDAAPLSGLGLGETQQAVLLSLKRLGAATQAEIGREVRYAPATLREHLQALIARALVERRGSRHGKPGRPEVVYALTERGDSLFPNRAAAVLRELIEFLQAGRHGALLDRFFAARVAARRPTALARVRGLRGVPRFQEVARLLSEEGFMALVGGTPEEPTLRLCHCPIRDLVAVTRLPCRFEQTLIADLLGRPLHRLEYLLDGQASCSYAAASTSSPVQESS